MHYQIFLLGHEDFRHSIACVLLVEEIEFLKKVTQHLNITPVYDLLYL